MPLKMQTLVLHQLILNNAIAVVFAYIDPTLIYKSCIGHGDSIKTQSLNPSFIVSASKVSSDKTLMVLDGGRQIYNKCSFLILYFNVIIYIVLEYYVFYLYLI